MDYIERLENLTEHLVREYGKHVSPEILKQYRPHETAIIFNDDDPDLYPIRMELPTPPAYHLIDGFGLPADKQYFNPPKMPVKLTKLIKKTGKGTTINEIYEHLDKNRSHYRSEIYLRQ